MFKRLWNMILGRANEAIDAIERPEDKLNLFVRDMESRIHNINTSVARAIADEKKLKMEIENHLAKSKDWESRAMLAIRESRDDLAREALNKKEEHEALARDAAPQWDMQKQAVGKLKQSLQDTKQRVEKEKRQYNLLLAKYNTAQSKKAISDTISSVNAAGNGGFPSLVEGLNNKILLLEAQTEAQLEMAGSNVGSDLESEFAKLESKGKVDDSLKALKEKMKSQSLLGASPVDKIDELKAKLG